MSSYLGGKRTSIITVGDGLNSIGDVIIRAAVGDLAPKLESTLQAVDDYIKNTSGSVSSGNAGGAIVVFGRGGWISKNAFRWGRQAVHFSGCDATYWYAAPPVGGGTSGDVLILEFNHAHGCRLENITVGSAPPSFLDPPLAPNVSPKPSYSFIKVTTSNDVVIDDITIDARYYSLFKNAGDFYGQLVYSLYNRDPYNMGYTNELCGIKAVGETGPINNFTVTNCKIIPPLVGYYQNPAVSPITKNKNHLGQVPATFVGCSTTGVGAFVFTDNIVGLSYDFNVNPIDLTNPPSNLALGYLSNLADDFGLCRVKYAVKMVDTIFKTITGNIFNPLYIERSMIYDESTYPHFDFHLNRWSEAGHFTLDGNVAHTLFYNDAIIHIRSGAFFTIGESNQFGQMFCLADPATNPAVIKVQSAPTGSNNLVSTPTPHNNPYRPSTCTIRGDYHWSYFLSSVKLCPTVRVEDCIQLVSIGPLEISNSFGAGGNGHSPVEIKNCKFVHIHSVTASPIWSAAYATTNPYAFTFSLPDYVAGTKLIKIEDDTEQVCTVIINGCCHFYGSTGIVNAAGTFSYSESVDLTNKIITATCKRIKHGRNFWFDSPGITPPDDSALGSVWVVKQSGS